MEIFNEIESWILLGGMILLAIMMILCLIRAILGPKFTDRIIAINMIGTKTIVIICILAIYLQENYIEDVAMVYALISFLAVAVLTRLYRKKGE